MRILTISNLYPPHAIGGYEERCRLTVDKLRSRGHEVRVLTSRHQTPSGREQETTVPAHVRRELRIHGFFGNPWLPPHRLFGLERHNHAQLRSQLGEFTPDVVHVWNLGGLSKSLMLTLQEWGGPVVYDVSDHWIARSLRADVWLRWWAGEAGGAGARLARGILRATGLSRWVHRRAPFAAWSDLRFDHIYFCSRALQGITVAAGWPVAQGRVIYCGVETKAYAVRPESPRFERLLYVGRLDPDKDPLTAVRALGELHRAGRRHLRLDLYGRGEAGYVAELKDAAAAAGVAEAVTFASAVSTDMPKIYARFDALLFTSAWEEPFALTPLEAMAAGLPVAGTPSGGSRELFRDGENGLVFAAGDAKALAAAVQRLDDDAELRRTVAACGLREVRERYDLEQIVDQIENYLKEAMA